MVGSLSGWVGSGFCLVEVLEECEGAIACQDIHEVAGKGEHSVKDASARPLLQKQLRRQLPAMREPAGGVERRKKRGLQWDP